MSINKKINYNLTYKNISKLEMLQILKLFFILLIVFILILFMITFLKNNLFLNETFSNEPLTTQGFFTNKPIDRTKLYGSIFLENLDQVITNMTDPDINYDTKRIDLNKYSDVLL